MFYLAAYMLLLDGELHPYPITGDTTDTTVLYNFTSDNSTLLTFFRSSFFKLRQGRGGTPLSKAALGRDYWDLSPVKATCFNASTCRIDSRFPPHDCQHFRTLVYFVVVPDINACLQHAAINSFFTTYTSHILYPLGVVTLPLPKKAVWKLCMLLNNRRFCLN